MLNEHNRWTALIENKYHMCSFKALETVEGLWKSWFLSFYNISFNRVLFYFNKTNNLHTTVWDFELMNITEPNKRFSHLIRTESASQAAASETLCIAQLYGKELIIKYVFKNTNLPAAPSSTGSL